MDYIEYFFAFIHVICYFVLLFKMRLKKSLYFYSRLQYGNQRVPTAASPSNTSSSSSHTGSQSGTVSTSLSNNVPQGNGNAASSEQLSKTNLYIRGLTPNTTDKDLVNMCSQ